MIELQVDDEDEIQYSRLIMGLFEKTAQIGASLETWIDPAEGARLFLDDARSPHYTVSGYAIGQLTVATGCIASLKQMTVRETEDTVNMIVSPFGAYAVVRNALDAAATAL
ncbi:hypothetical protein GCM10023346_39080 [Arthrobacter gyeryongensis]|uniref:Uncharacterized protein n=1 Tax=Arthrobacter gyeryongensis TaxID=1650592 RepID=A0ABP9SN09_9MICC